MHNLFVSVLLVMLVIESRVEDFIVTRHGKKVGQHWHLGYGVVQLFIVLVIIYTIWEK